MFDRKRIRNYITSSTRKCDNNNNNNNDNQIYNSQVFFFDLTRFCIRMNCFIFSFVDRYTN